MADQESRPSVQETMQKSAELGRDSKDIGRDARKTNVEFLKTELATGLTFANAAMESRESERKLRNRANARKAYDTVTQYLTRHSDSEMLSIEREELEPGLTELRKVLGELDETK